MLASVRIGLLDFLLLFLRLVIWNHHLWLIFQLKNVCQVKKLSLLIKHQFLVKVELLSSLGDGFERHKQLAVRRSEQVFQFRPIGEYFRVSQLGIAVREEVYDWWTHAGGLRGENWCADDCWTGFSGVCYGNWNVNARIAEIHFCAPQVGAVDAEDDLWPLKFGEFLKKTWKFKY